MKYLNIAKVVCLHILVYCVYIELKSRIARDVCNKLIIIKLPILFLFSCYVYHFHFSQYANDVYIDNILFVALYGLGITYILSLHDTFGVAKPLPISSNQLNQSSQSIPSTSLTWSEDAVPNSTKMPKFPCPSSLTHTPVNIYVDETNTIRYAQFTQHYIATINMVAKGGRGGLGGQGTPLRSGVDGGNYLYGGGGGGGGGAIVNYIVRINPYDNIVVEVTEHGDVKIIIKHNMKTLDTIYATVGSDGIGEKAGKGGVSSQSDIYDGENGHDGEIVIPCVKPESGGNGGRSVFFQGGLGASYNSIDSTINSGGKGKLGSGGGGQIIGTDAQTGGGSPFISIVLNNC